MTMRVLEFFYEEYLQPSGGPAGYLFNLRKSRDESSDNELFFLNEKRDLTFFYRLKRKMHVLFKCMNVRSDNAKYIERVIYESSHKGTVDLSSYDAVHFHSTFDLYSQKMNLEDYKGIVILTSHTPKAKYKEYIEDYSSPEEYAAYKEIFDKAEEFDRFAFERADYVIFPCRGAEDPYLHTWERYKDIRDEKKILYVPTGTPTVKPKKTRAEVRKELGISDDQFVVSYVGRHIPVKGYDSLISIFEKSDDITVVCCGNPGRIPSPESERWKEVGWTNDPYSYVAASDLFILPNRETYFDLALLEVLSLGKTSLISNTGGNREFAGMEDCGIYLFDSNDEAAELIKNIMREDPSDKARREASQVEMYKEKYSAEVFYSRYKETLRNIIERGRS